MIGKVGDLAHQLVFVLVLGSDDDFHRLLAHLLRDLIDAAPEEVRRVRTLDGVCLPIVHDALQLPEEGQPALFRLDDGIVEAAARARMAGCARLLDPQKNAVPVAVEGRGDDLLHVPARLALLPEALSRAAVIVGIACFKRLLQRFLVHVRLHEHFARRMILRDRTDEPVTGKLDR